MVLIEMREAAFDKAMGLIDEAKEHSKQTKLTLCELEDTLYDCYESVKDTESDEEYEKDDERYERPMDDNEELEISYRGMRGNRSRRNMRMRYREDDDHMMDGYRRGYRRMGRRMRGGRYSY